MGSRHLGIAAAVQPRPLLKRETEAIKLCKPVDTIEIIGLGRATVDRSGAKSTASAMHPPRRRTDRFPR